MCQVAQVRSERMFIYQSTYFPTLAERHVQSCGCNKQVLGGEHVRTCSLTARCCSPSSAGISGQLHQRYEELKGEYRNGSRKWRQRHATNSRFWANIGHKRLFLLLRAFYRLPTSTCKTLNSAHVPPALAQGGSAAAQRPNNAGSSACTEWAV